MKILITKNENETTRIHLDGGLEGKELGLLNDINYHLKEIVKHLDKAEPTHPKPYVSPVTEALDREARMHEADATDSPF
jgi:hypothetical protein